MIVLDVLGTPAPKGSSRAILRGGRAVNVAGSSDVGKAKLRSWDANVRDQALRELGDRQEPAFVARPLRVGIVFRLLRPSGHYHKKTGALKPASPPAPATKPDIDKLARSTLDSLTGLVFDDDSRIVELGVVKIYAVPGREGARITVEEWRPSR